MSPLAQELQKTYDQARAIPLGWSMFLAVAGKSMGRGGIVMFKRGDRVRVGVWSNSHGLVLGRSDREGYWDVQPDALRGTSVAVDQMDLELVGEAEIEIPVEDGPSATNIGALVRAISGPYRGQSGVVERRDTGHPGCARVRFPGCSGVWIEDGNLERLPANAPPQEGAARPCLSPSKANPEPAFDWFSGHIHELPMAEITTVGQLQHCRGRVLARWFTRRVVTLAVLLPSGLRGTVEVCPSAIRPVKDTPEVEPKAEPQPEPDPKSHAVRILYHNHRGSCRYRTVLPQSIRYGVSDCHPEPQWLLHAIDMEKNEQRAFAMRDILSWDSSPAI